jgi:hypothetical protein
MSMSIRSARKQTRALSQIAELARISPLVVARRTARMSHAGKSAVNQREAHLMVQEKVNASMESMVNMTVAALRIQAQFAALLMRPWLVTGGLAAKDSRSFTALMQSSAADFSSSAVSPFLRKAKANAKRLAG